MGLASQSARPMSRRSYMSRRRRSRRGKFLILILLIGGGTWWALSGDSSTTEKTGDEVNTTPSNTDAPEQVASTDNSNRMYDASTGRTTTTTPVPTPVKEPTAVRSTTDEASTITAKAPASETTSPGTAAEPTSTTKTASAPRQNPQATNASSSKALQLAFDQSANDPVLARTNLTKAWLGGGLSFQEEVQARELANNLSEIVLYDSRIIANDPFVKRYTVKSGDALERIVRRQNVDTDWRFIARINGLPNANAIRPGQTLKLPVGTFHAVVNKDKYRMDIFQDNGNQRVLVGSFNVGLGEYDGTPTGLFRVRPASKLINPHWINPKTRKQYAADDPENPIGEHWIGIKGLESHNKDLDGFGIHGTVEPDSIGRQESMGCVRMLPDDVKLVYEILTEPSSTIEIIGSNRIAVQPEE